MLPGCAIFDSAPDPAALYPSKNLPIEMSRTVVLKASGGRRVPLKIFYPQEGGPYPLIVLSHGTFSSIERYDLIAEYWAAQGYVVILPQHKDANYGVVPTGYAVMQEVTVTRVADMSLVLNKLNTIEGQIPELAGRIRRGGYVAAGHSIGTQVAMLNTGLRYRTEFNDSVMASNEYRYKALVLVSDPGKMRLMPEDLWLASSVPTFMATGTDDYGLMGSREESTEPQSEVVSTGADVDRYMLLLDKGDHYFGGLVQKEVDAEPDHGGLEIFNATSTAFLDAYMKRDDDAYLYLSSVDMQAVTQQRARLEKAP
jgi:dienelactone hydrolase